MEDRIKTKVQYASNYLRMNYHSWQITDRQYQEVADCYGIPDHWQDVKKDVKNNKLEREV